MMDKKTIISAFGVAVAAALAISAISYGDEDPASIQHRYITPSMRVSTNAWLSVSGRVERTVADATDGFLRKEKDPLFSAWKKGASIEAGSTAYAFAPLTVAVGADSKAMEQQSTAIGYSANAMATLATAIGAGAYGSGYSSVAIGASASAGDRSSVAIGESSFSHGIGTFNITATSPSLFYLGDRTLQSFLDAYAKPSVTNGLASKEEVAAVDNKADEAYSAAEQMVDAVNSLSGTIGTHIRDTNNPHKVTAAQVGALPITGGTLTGDLAVGKEHTASRKLTVAAANGAAGIELQGGTSSGIGSSLSIGGSSGDGGTLWVNGGLLSGGTVIVEPSTEGGGGVIRVRGSDASIKKGDKEVATEAYVDDKVRNAVLPTDTTFSNAVLAVGLNIDTDSVAVLNEIASTFGGFPIEGTATTVGGLLAALAAAVAWLRKNKADKATTLAGYGIIDAATKTELAALTAKVEYPLYAVPSTGVLKDRAINTASLATVTVPDNFTDLLIRASVTSSLSVTMPDAIATKYGDTFPGDGGEYLVTITKTGAAEAYVRTIKLEVANA